MKEEVFLKLLVTLSSLGGRLGGGLGTRLALDVLCQRDKVAAAAVVIHLSRG